MCSTNEIDIVCHGKQVYSLVFLGCSLTNLISLRHKWIAQMLVFQTLRREVFSCFTQHVKLIWSMIAQIFCLTSGSGLPLLLRKKGDPDLLSFSHIASLNGVHLFAKSHEVILKNTITQDTVLYWKEYFDSVMLIGVASAVSTEILEKFLDSVFNAMVLCLGIEEMTKIRNPERLKRELRITHRLLDKLFDCLESGDKIPNVKNAGGSSKSTSGDIIEFVETILCQENQALQNCLENYVEAVESLYGCITIHGKLAVATQSWWELENEEKKLLNALISVLNANSTSSDVPVFLPYKSPSVPFRLVTLRLINGIEISTLCGPSPSLSEIEQSVLQIWRPMIEVLRSAEKTYPRNFPVSVSLDANVLGFLLINIPNGKFLISRNQSKKESCSLSGSHRLNILRTFYYQSASVFLMNDTDRKGKTETEPETKDGECEKLALETYWCSEYHKCHALRSGPNVICVLYAASVPTHTMRLGPFLPPFVFMHLTLIGRGILAYEEFNISGAWFASKDVARHPQMARKDTDEAMFKTTDK